MIGQVILFAYVLGPVRDSGMCYTSLPLLLLRILPNEQVLQRQCSAI